MGIQDEYHPSEATAGILNPANLTESDILAVIPQDDGRTVEGEYGESWKFNVVFVDDESEGEITASDKPEGADEYEQVDVSDEETYALMTGAAQILDRFYDLSQDGNLVGHVVTITTNGEGGMARTYSVESVES